MRTAPGGTSGIVRTLCRPFPAFRWFPIHKPSSNSTVLVAWITEPAMALVLMMIKFMLTCSIAPAGKDPINLRLSLVSTRSKIPDTFFTWLLATSGENPVLVQRGFNFPMGSFACTMTSMTCLWEN